MADKLEGGGLIKIKAQYLIALICLIHSLFFLVYGFAVGGFRSRVDVFLFDAIGWSLPYVTMVMILTATIFLLTLFRFFGLGMALKHRTWKPVIPDVFFFIAWPLFLLLFYGGFVIIFQQEPSQKGVVRYLLDLARLVGDPVLFLVAAIGLRRLVLMLRGGMVGARRRWPWTIGITLVLIALVGLWLIPALYPPSWAYLGDMPTRPALIAHRGASMLAPENTLASIELSARHQALGLQADVRISQDGVPFLMHDETLARTTNIAEVYPQRVNEPASNFTMDELKSLNAGLWFIQKDPFGRIETGHVSQNQLSINQGQAIPTLAEALEVVGDQGLVILLDLMQPPREHPFYEEFFETIIDESVESGLNSNIWVLAAQNQLAILRERAPQMARVAGVTSTNLPDADSLVEQTYQIINVDTGITARQIRAYREKRLGVNVYTIDEPWLFSQFWLAGVTSVTTNNVQAFSQLDRPVLNLPYARYMMYWGLLGIVVAIWLASSQPEPEPIPAEDVKPPDLLDFAIDEDEPIISVSLGNEQPVVESRPSEDNEIVSQDEWSNQRIDEESWVSDEALEALEEKDRDMNEDDLTEES